jgi:AAA+ superfamily predicted ATPase
LFRRFDDVIRYELPDQAQAEVLLRNSLSVLAGTELDYAELARKALGLSHSDIVKASADAMKDAVLEGESFVAPERVTAHLNERASGQLYLT